MKAKEYYKQLFDILDSINKQIKLFKKEREKIKKQYFDLFNNKL